MSFSSKRFIIGFILGFIVTTWVTTLWIPYDYPTAPFWVVWYWQAKDQLFRVHKYVYMVIPVSVCVGLALVYLSSTLKR